MAGIHLIVASLVAAAAAPAAGASDAAGTVVASGKGRAGPILVDGDVLFFVAGDCVNRWDAKLGKLRTVACARKPIDPLADAVIAASRDDIFVALTAGSGRWEKPCAIHRVPKAGGQLVELAVTNPCPDTLVSDGADLFGSGHGVREVGASVWRIPAGGGEKQELARFEGSTERLFLIDDELRWQRAFPRPALVAMAKSGGPMRELRLGSAYNLAGDARGLFGYVDNWLVRLEPGDRIDRLLDVPGCQRTPTVDADFVYLMHGPCPYERKPVSLTAVPRAGGPPRELARLGWAESMAVGPDGLYLLAVEAQDCGELRALAKRVRGPVLGMCKPSRWGLRRIALPSVPASPPASP